MHRVRSTSRWATRPIASTLKTQVAAALADDDAVLWLTDRRGRDIGIPSERIAYIEIGAPNDDRKIGFGG